MSAIMQMLAAGGAPIVVGQQAYTAAGTYSWTCPSGVTSVSVVCVGAWINNGFGSGALAYKNNIAVTPGNSYAVVVALSDAVARSSFNSDAVVSAGQGSNRTGDGGGGSVNSIGAGGYSGNGGDLSQSGTGGGGGGPASASNNADPIATVRGGGGGVGILGEGSSGVGAAPVTYPAAAGGGGGGSGGTAGGTTTTTAAGAAGSYGGTPGVYSDGVTAVRGTVANGAVRIIWPGNTRSFPSTNTANM